MTLTECYQKLGGDYEDILSRLGDDELILYFMKMFLQDESYTGVLAAMEQGDMQNAYKQVHTLKGVCVNLSFDKLAAIAAQMSSLLIDEHFEQAKEILPELIKEYERTKSLLKDVCS